MTRDIKKKKFCKYVGDKRKTKENVSSLPKEMGQLVTQNMEKAEVSNDFSVSVFISKCSSHTDQVG